MWRIAIMNLEMKITRFPELLLYAKTDEEIQPDNVYKMHGNQITVRTLDLNKPFADIAKQLNTIAETHFDLPERSKVWQTKKR